MEQENGAGGRTRTITLLAKLDLENNVVNTTNKIRYSGCDVHLQLVTCTNGDESPLILIFAIALAVKKLVDCFHQIHFSVDQ